MATNYTLQDLADLEIALASGVLRTTHGGTTTDFRSRDEIIAQIRLMRLELGMPVDNVPNPSNNPPIRRVRYVFRKGLR